MKHSPLKDPPTLPDFFEHVASTIPAKYFKFGLAIGVKSPALKGYQTVHNHNQLRCFESIFNDWKNQVPGLKPFKWSSAVAALQTKTVGENTKANKIKEMIAPPA